MEKESEILKISTCALIITICFWVGLTFGFRGFATLTEQGGYWGSLPYRYQLSDEQFGLYNLAIALLTVPISMLVLAFTLHKEYHKLNWIYLAFCLFMLLVILAERYMDSRYVGKG